MPHPKTTNSDHQPDDIDDAIVGFIYHQLRASAQEVSLPDRVLRLPSTSCLAFKTARHETTESVSDEWSLFVSSCDLEPTPIKSDLNQEKRDIASFHDWGSSTPNSKRPNKRRSNTKHARNRKRKSNQPTFRGYQQKQFHEKFEALLRFKEEYGHCLVPHTYKANQSLSRWVKRQRYQYKMLQDNTTKEASAMTQERIAMLESIGFVWDSHKLAWRDRLKELEDYKNEYGNCDVPSTYRKNPALATWVKCQRRQYRRFQSWDESKIMSLDRIASLEALGFNWEGIRNKGT